MSDVTVRPGDLYCPRCLGAYIEMWVSGSGLSWDCRRCGRFEHPYGTDSESRFEWKWDENHPKPNPGCPWCGSCNIAMGKDWKPSGNYPTFHVYWWCNRLSCRANWLGYWTLFAETNLARWTIRVPVQSVPWVYATTPADLKCFRRVPGGLAVSHSDYFPACCRFPKSCSAYDGEIIQGIGPRRIEALECSGCYIPDGSGEGYEPDLPDIDPDCPVHT